MSDDLPKLSGLEAVAHTVVRHASDGVDHIQHYGAAHVVEGSVVVFDLLPGQSVVIRHINVEGRS